MGYKRMTYEDLSSIFKRWHDGQKQSHIAKYESKDRKTIRILVTKFLKHGLLPGCEIHDKNELSKFLLSLLPDNKRKSGKQDLLLKIKDEIRELLCDKSEPLDMLHAWKVIKSRHLYDGSYETFKKFVRKNSLSIKLNNETIRMELPPGSEIQIDYGKVGMLLDKYSGKNRTVYAFCGILSYSRLPFIRFEYRQDNESFVNCNMRMLDFYGGVPEFISLDNLKAGVIKPDVYDPKLNRSYEEMADHYKVFINPCRVMKPKDKGKIERFITPARQLFRMLKNIHPLADLVELNKLALKWCIEDYGMKKHGTTGIPPLLAYESLEKEKLKLLPEIRFEVPKWKYPKVGQDQFISFEKKYYSLPAKYKGLNVWVKRVNNVVSIYYAHELIRTYIVPINQRTFCKEDFPAIKNEMMNNGYVTYLLNKAKTYGEESFKLVERVLSPHAFLNLRRAQGILSVIEKYASIPMFSETCAEALGRNINDPKKMIMLFEDARTQMQLPLYEMMSDNGKKMTRVVDYYFSDNLQIEDKTIQ